jgi:predicted histone-like DNA-binding protein
MIYYKLVKNTIKSNSASYGKWYARAVIGETIDLAGLAEHMASHNSPYSSGTIRGLLTDMVTCIKELILDSKAVRIDDLVIFRPEITNTCGCAKQDDYRQSEYISGIHINTRGVGNFSKAQLDLELSLKRSALDKNEEVQQPSDEDLEV